MTERVQHEISRISQYEEAREAAEWLIHSSWAAGVRQNKLVEQYAKLDQVSSSAVQASACPSTSL